jgi:hypothetical protein
MGGGSSKQFAGVHILHSTRFNENKIFIYVPETQTFQNFLMTSNGAPLNLFVMESISTPRGSIFCCGGQIIPPNVSIKDKTYQELFPELIDTDKCFEIDLNSNVNGEIDVKIHDEWRLPEPRSGHLMMCHNDAIYVIGGWVKNLRVKSCLKFDFKKKSWSSIANIGVNISLTEPCGIAVGESIYVFDTEVDKNVPRVLVYNIENNVWSETLIDS